MNKYQKALERLENITSVPSIFIEAVVEDLVVIFKELVDKETSMQLNNNKRKGFETILTMNRYQEAIKRVELDFEDRLKEDNILMVGRIDIEVLQELVDKYSEENKMNKMCDYIHHSKEEKE